MYLNCPFTLSQGLLPMRLWNDMRLSKWKQFSFLGDLPVLSHLCIPENRPNSSSRKLDAPYLRVGWTVGMFVRVEQLSGPSHPHVKPGLAVNPFLVLTNKIYPGHIMRILVAVMSNMFHNCFLQKQGNFFKLFLDTELMTKCTEVTVRGKIVLCELFSLSKGVQNYSWSATVLQNLASTTNKHTWTG